MPSETITDVAWKIFYADENNIYLIADNYIERTSLPNSTTEDGKITTNKPNDGENNFSSTNDNLYVINSQNNARAMWLASPDAYATDYVMVVTCDVYTGRGGIIYKNRSFRSLVCLKSDIQLQENLDKTYTIQ